MKVKFTAEIANTEIEMEQILEILEDIKEKLIDWADRVRDPKEGWE